MADYQAKTLLISSQILLDFFLNNWLFDSLIYVFHSGSSEGEQKDD